jgi:hypothetical protein
VLSLLESSTRILTSTMPGSARTVFSRVFSALYAGITTAMRFPSIMSSLPNCIALGLLAFDDGIRCPCFRAWRLGCRL